jgi:hypothetical protein
MSRNKTLFKKNRPFVEINITFDKWVEAPQHRAVAAPYTDCGETCGGVAHNYVEFQQV